MQQPLTYPEAVPLAGSVDRELNVEDITVSEVAINSASGAGVCCGVLTAPILIALLAIMAGNGYPLIGIFILPVAVLFFVGLMGIRMVSPNEAYVATLCGAYRGVLRKTGLRVIFPFYGTKCVSLRLNNFESPSVKVNDQGGCPVDMRAVVVWRVVDAAQAVYHVQNLEQFVRMQTETGLRSLAAQYPYDTGLSATTSAAEITLRNGGEHVSEVLRTLVQRRVRIAGVEVVEARISHLAYAQEIASSMLMRQQAQAVIAARRQVVDGAVGIAKDTVERIEKEITVLNAEGKAAILSNLLTTLVSEHNVQPVLALGGK